MPSSLNQTFILMGCREYLYISVCIDMMLVLLKWNGQMLMKWLSEQFWNVVHVFMFSLVRRQTLISPEASRALLYE